MYRYSNVQIFEWLSSFIFYNDLTASIADENCLSKDSDSEDSDPMDSDYKYSDPKDSDYKGSDYKDSDPKDRLWLLGLWL